MSVTDSPQELGRRFKLLPLLRAALLVGALAAAAHRVVDPAGSAAALVLAILALVLGDQGLVGDLGARCRRWARRW
eukprot:2602832-Alexandrium_andersonii.AAC.1